MRFLLLLSSIIVAACNFTPLYSSTQNPDVCVDPIPEHTGYIVRRALKDHFSGSSDCKYTLQVEKPTFSLTDAGISDHSFTTTQRIQAKTSYTLLDAKHKKVLSSSVVAEGSSSIVNNPYASVVAREANEEELLTILANNIQTHVSTFLLRDNK